MIMQSTHSRRDLDKVRGGYKPPPAVNRSSPKGYWKGIPPGELASIMTHLLTVRRKWDVVDERYALSQDEANMVAAYAVRLPTWLPPPGCEYLVAVASSNAQRKAVTIYGGVTLPTGGCMVTRADVLCKHTKGQDYTDVINQGVIRVRQYDWKWTPDLVQEMMRTPIPLAVAESLLVQAGREGYMPWSRVGMVDALYRDGAALGGTGTAWDLARAFSKVGLKNPPLNQLDQMYGFWTLLKSHVRCSFTSNSVTDVVTGQQE